MSRWLLFWEVVVILQYIVGSCRLHNWLYIVEMHIFLLSFVWVWNVLHTCTKMCVCSCWCVCLLTCMSLVCVYIKYLLTGTKKLMLTFYNLDWLFTCKVCWLCNICWYSVGMGNKNKCCILWKRVWMEYVNISIGCPFIFNF